MLISWAPYKNWKARMFWVEKLHLSHQAWPSRSQPCIRNQGPAASFFELLLGEGKQEEVCVGVGALQATGAIAITMPAPGALAVWALVRHCKLSQPALCCPVPCGFRKPGAPSLPFYSPDTGHLISLHLCFLWRDRDNQTQPLLLQQCSREDWMSQGDSACTGKSTVSLSPSSPVPHTAATLHSSPVVTGL